MTVVLGPTWAYEQRDKLVTLQWSVLYSTQLNRRLRTQVSDTSMSASLITKLYYKNIITFSILLIGFRYQSGRL